VQSSSWKLWLYCICKDCNAACCQEEGSCRSSKHNLIFWHVAVAVFCAWFVGCYVSRSMPRLQSTVDFHWILWRLMLVLVYLSWLRLYLISAIRLLLSMASIFLLKMCFLNTPRSVQLLYCFCFPAQLCIFTWLVI